MTKEEVGNKALEATKNYSRCSVALGTGMGKTKLGLTHADIRGAPNKKILIVGPKLSVFTTWKEEAVKYNLSHTLVNADFCVYRSLHKKNPTDYDLIYFDECHNLLESHLEFLNNTTADILGLTGTPPVNKRSIKYKIIQTYCPIVYEYKTDTAVSDGLLNDYLIIVHKLPLNTEKTLSIETKHKKFMTSELLNYKYLTTRTLTTFGKQQQFSRIMRMKQMMVYPSKEKYAKKLFDSIQDKCMLFANEKAQADRLCTYSYHSGNPDSERNLEWFKQGKITKLSSILQLKEGINVPDLRQSIVMHAYANNVNFHQRLGRILRLNPDETAIMHILCYKDTVDEEWVTSALEPFNPEKIKWKEYVW